MCKSHVFFLKKVVKYAIYKKNYFLIVELNFSKKDRAKLVHSKNVSNIILIYCFISLGLIFSINRPSYYT